MNAFPVSVAAAAALPEFFSPLQNLSFLLAKPLLSALDLPALFFQISPDLSKYVTLLGAAF